MASHRRIPIATDSRRHVDQTRRLRHDLTPSVGVTVGYITVAVALSLATSSALGQATSSSSEQMLNQPCRAGVSGVIGGKHRCLRDGQRCEQRLAFPISRSPYRRYGFVCVLESDHFVLHRVARPGIAPSNCPGLNATPMSVPPGAAYSSRFIGGTPLWAGPYLKIDQARGVWRFTQRLAWRVNGGWPVKLVWVTARREASPIVATITDLRTARKLRITVDGLFRASGTSVTLDPQRPSHPDSDDKPETHEWGSSVSFTNAGCYRLDGVWPEGALHVIFSFGR
jgi:hypothetical protein